MNFLLWFLWFMVFNATFNNILVISWRSVLLVEETGVPSENHRPIVSHWQTLSHCCIQYTSQLYVIYILIAHVVVNPTTIRPRQSRIKVNLFPNHRSTLVSLAPSTTMHNVKTNTTSWCQTQHNCKMPNVLFHFSYIFLILGVFLNLISGWSNKLPCSRIFVVSPCPLIP